MATYKVRGIGDQQLLDRADAAYRAASIEFGGTMTPAALHSALMAAWKFIDDVTRQESE